MIELKGVSKSFALADGTVEALKDVSLTIEDGDIYGIIGMSGAGKSTLVRCINMLEHPTTGQVVVNGTDLCELTEKQLRKERRNITMIFQNFNLMLQKNCLKNVCFPMELEGVEKSKARQKALELLDLVGLKEKAKAYPSQLSGGQQQRVAIARALATNPQILLCDEATSALDPKTTNDILSLLRDINEKLGLTVILITHQMSVVEAICRHVAILENGTVVEEGEVGEIFTNPKTPAAKRLVCPEGDTDTAVFSEEEKKAFSNGGKYRFIRVVFDGSDATVTPIIARMATQTGIEASIASASTRTIKGKAYGSMILGVENGEGTVSRAIAYLTQNPGVTAKEVQ